MLFIVPAYAIISSLKLEADEKLFFSLFIGLGLFPLAVYWLDRVLSSLLMSSVLVFITATAIGLALKIFIKRH